MSNWDERYLQGEHIGDEPHPLIVAFASKLTPGRALDVASGPGRHTIWLAERGWQVTAVDNSSVALQILKERALAKALAIDVVAADLAQHEFVIAPKSYDLILVCNYLQRDLILSIREGVRIGGVVIAVIALVDDDPDVKPMNPAFLLHPGELRSQFHDWEWLHDFEGKPAGNPNRRAIAELVARRRG